MTIFNPNNHITGKVYDLTQDNFNTLLKDWERLKNLKCSHGPYKVEGSMLCRGCDINSILYYTLRDVCEECEYKSLNKRGDS